MQRTAPSSSFVSPDRMDKALHRCWRERFGGLVLTGKAVDLKSTEPQGSWGFESLALRCIRESRHRGEVAEWSKARAC
jgi:hypothetical protein